MAMNPGLHTVTEATQIPDDVRRMMAMARERAENLYGPSVPFRPYQGPRIAPLAAERHQAHQMAREQQPSPHFHHAHNIMQQGSSFPQNVQQYMNPHQHHVVNRIAELGNRQFKEQTLPDLSASFGKHGMFGSTFHQDLAHRAARDMQGEVLASQQSALHQGYGQAAEHHKWEQQRILEHAKATQDLAKLHHAIDLSKMTALEQAGATKQEMEQARLEMEEEQYRREQQHPYDMLAAYMAAINGIPYEQRAHKRTEVPRPGGLHRGDWQGAGMNVAGNVLGALAQRHFGWNLPFAGKKKKGGHILISQSGLKRHKARKKR